MNDDSCKGDPRDIVYIKENIEDIFPDISIDTSNPLNQVLIVSFLSQGVIDAYDNFVVKSLIYLLRSGDDINQMLRSQLADAIEGVHENIRIDIKRKKKGKKPKDISLIVDFQKYNKQLPIGYYIYKMTFENKKVESSIIDAMDKYKISRSYAFDCWVIFQFANSRISRELSGEKLDIFYGILEDNL